MEPFGNPLPDDAELIQAQVSGPYEITLYVSSSQYPLVEEGSPVPYVDEPTYRTIY